MIGWDHLIHLFIDYLLHPCISFCGLFWTSYQTDEEIIVFYLSYFCCFVFSKGPSEKMLLPAHLKPSFQLECKLPRLLSCITNYSKLCRNYMFFTCIMSHFVCASEVLRTNQYFAEHESRQAANKCSSWWKSGMCVNVYVSKSLPPPGWLVHKRQPEWPLYWVVDKVEKKFFFFF